MTEDLKEPKIQREVFAVASEEYDDVIRRSDTPWGRYYEKKVFQVVSKVIPNNRMFMLDVGGGTGAFTKLFVDSFKYVVDADLSREMLKEGKEKGNILTVEIDAQRLPFKDDAFDLTLCIDTLHHLPNAEQVVSEMKRVTKGGGVVVVIEINHNWMEPLRHKLMKFAEKWGKEERKKTISVTLYQESIHIDRLRQIFNKVGLTDYKTYNRIFIPPAIQNKYVLRGLELLEMLVERIPIIKEISGKVCFVGFVDDARDKLYASDECVEYKPR
ncbi:MAG: class I SAM-dependent methyltransferase [Thermoplasmatales archaeon]|nr:class I SAM-dependent methyltransferase [Thermoplasmatales archaeon]